MDNTDQVNPFRIALTHRCPRCEKGALYQGITKLADQCEHCGLSFTEHDSGDGPAFFTICVLGFLVTGAAVAVEFTLRPSYLTHIITWPIVMLMFTPFWLRFFKSYLLAMQYKVHLLEPDQKDE